MTHAYQEIYLNNAQALLGDAFDYAINACGIAGGSFMKLFSVSSISNRIENGEAAYIMGKSGIEAAVDVLVETTGKAPTAKPKANFNRSREYWIGWAVAYYQWFSGRKFSDIFKVLSFEDLERIASMEIHYAAPCFEGEELSVLCRREGSICRMAVRKPGSPSAASR